MTTIEQSRITFMTPDKAAVLILRLQADDPETDYRLEHNPRYDNGRNAGWFIALYDNGRFVGTL